MTCRTNDESRSSVQNHLKSLNFSFRDAVAVIDATSNKCCGKCAPAVEGQRPLDAAKLAELIHVATYTIAHVSLHCHEAPCQ